MYLAKQFDFDITYDLIETDDISTVNLENYDGLNVTIPYKTEVMSYLNYFHKSSEVLGSVNTIDQDLKGYNTDIAGFSYLMDKVLAKPEDKIVVLGSGAMGQMIKKAYKNVVIISRTGEYNYDNYEQVQGDVLVNATPISMGTSFNDLLVSEDYIKTFKGVIDLNYNPGISRFTNVAASAFINNTNGLDMLIIQAVKAFEIWHDVKVEDQVIDKLRSHILSFTQPNIAIIGMPLAGKSSLFKEGEFIDLDAEIEEIVGMPISDFITFMGVDEFRKIERVTLNDLIKDEPKVIVLGGGAVLDFENRLTLSNYQILHLNTDLDTLLKRSEKNHRPLIKSSDDLVKLYEEREVYYKYFKTGDYNENSSN